MNDDRYIIEFAEDSYLQMRSAYAEAVAQGYTGTREEFGRLQADFAESAQMVAEYKDQAEAAASEASSHASAAEGYRDSTYESESRAGEYAYEAGGYAHDAEGYAHDAEGYATDAMRAADRAEEAASSVDITEISGRVSDVEHGLADVEHDLSSEITRAQAAETSIYSELSSEISRATAVEDSLTSGLQAEVSRAQLAEKDLEDGLYAEADRAQAAEGSLRADIDDEATRAMAAEDGLADDLSAETTRAQAAESALSDDMREQFVSKSGPVDTEPYSLRQSKYKDVVRMEDKLVGGTVVWNQLIPTTGGSSTKDGVTYTNNRDGSWTVEGTPTSTNSFCNLNYKSNTHAIQNNHVYLILGISANVRMQLLTNTKALATIGSASVRKITNLASGESASWARLHCDNTSITISETVRPALFDLTQMFGTAIADYIYSLEQAVTGAGVDWFKKYFPEVYYPYDEGTLESVEGVSAHEIAGQSDLHAYPLDSSLTLRGVPKLDSNNRLVYDGDTYESDGTVTRKYGVVDLGTLNWTYATNVACFIGNSPADSFGMTAYGNGGLSICGKYLQFIGTTATIENKTMLINSTNVSSGKKIAIRDDAYTDAATFKAAMSGVYLVYELATPTTESAEPFTNPQICEPSGTERYITDSIVPVGHETQYFDDLKAKLEVLPWNFSGIIAPTETAPKASKNYAVGDYLIYNNTLYKVTAAIASGGTLTVGTNVTATTVMAEIRALQ